MMVSAKTFFIFCNIFSYRTEVFLHFYQAWSKAIRYYCVYEGETKLPLSEGQTTNLSVWLGLKLKIWGSCGQNMSKIWALTHSYSGQNMSIIWLRAKYDSGQNMRAKYDSGQNMSIAKSEHCKIRAKYDSGQNMSIDSLLLRAKYEHWLTLTISLKIL